MVSNKVNPTLVGPTSRAELLQTDSNLLVIDSKENAGSLGRSKAQPSTGGAAPFD